MAINTTPNLHLPQWTPNEKPSYLVDFNAAFKNIDDGFAGITTEADSANQTALGAMAEASSAMSQAQAAMQTANQAQTALNNHVASLTPSLIVTPTNPTSSTITYSVLTVYNSACANIDLTLTFTAETPISTSPFSIGTVTFPANIDFGNTDNNIQLGASGYGVFGELRRTSTKNVYDVYLMVYAPFGAGSLATNQGTYPVYIETNTRTSEHIIHIMV